MHTFPRQARRANATAIPLVTWPRHRAATFELGDELPTELIDVLGGLRAGGWLLVRGAPVGPVGSTPGPGATIASGTTMARVVTEIMSALGAQVSSIADVAPALGHREISAEAVHVPSTPDSRVAFIGLGCLRGDPQAVTRVLPSNRLLVSLNGSEYALARKNIWISWHLTTAAHAVEHDDFESLPLDRSPILRDDSPIPRVVYSERRSRLAPGLGYRGNHLIPRIANIVARDAAPVALRPGDILVIDPSRTLVSRSAYRPRGDGSDRFLLRAHGSTIKDPAAVKVSTQ